jgi:hypothetical protein
MQEIYHTTDNHDVLICHEENGSLDFSVVIAFLKKGEKAQRLQWCDSRKFLVIKDNGIKKELYLQYDDGRTFPWFSNSDDILAEDWLIVS